MTSERWGVVFRPQLPPSELQGAVATAERAGMDDLWLWEDCFLEGGLTMAAAALAWSDELRVGVGLLPVPFRNPALAAMELATVAGLFPGRFAAGLGHGVQPWMAQVGAKVDSPLTLLREHTRAIRQLLDGRTVTTQGRYVDLHDVALDWPPDPPPSLLVGGRGPKTLQLAAELADGTILDAGATLDDLACVAELTRGRVDHEIVVYVEVADGEAQGQLVARLDRLRQGGATTLVLQSTEDRRSFPELVATAAKAREALRGS